MQISHKYAVEILIMSLDITRGIFKSDSDYIWINFRRNTVFVIHINQTLVPILLKTKIWKQIYSVTSTHIGIIERFMQLFLSASSVGKYKLNKNSNTKLLTGCLFVETYTQNVFGIFGMTHFNQKTGIKCMVQLNLEMKITCNEMIS